MTVTEDRLIQALHARAEAVRPKPEATGRLHARLRVRRRRTWLATAAAAIAAAVAVGLTVPGHTGHATVVPAKPAAAYPAYQQGGKAIAGGQIVSPAQGALTFTFAPTSYQLYLATFCTNPRTLVSVAVNGHLASFGACGGGLGNIADPAASQAAWKISNQVILGRPNTVTVTLVDADTPTARTLPPSKRPAGTVSAAIYQGVPLADYPLPAKPARLAPLTANGGEAVVLDSRVVGGNGTFTVPLPVGSRLDLTAIAPGQIDVWANGQHLETEAFWTYHDQTASIDLTAGRLREPRTIPTPGESVTVRITASRFTGPYWLASTGAGVNVDRASSAPAP